MSELNVQCPHCAAQNPAGAAFCKSCGKALPLAAAPRVLTGSEIPASSAGAKLLGDELTKQVRTASNTLLAIGFLQLIIGTLLVVVVASALHVPLDNPNIIMGMVVQCAIAAVFFGLYFWARKAPLPASIVGLVVYGTLILLNIVRSANAMAQGGAGGRGFGGCGIGWLDILIIVLLSRGISAALKHRKLLAAQAAPPPTL
jgi:hypothetical protein